MKYTDNALNILTIKSFKGIGRAWIIKYIKGNETVDKLLFLLNKYSKQEFEISNYNFELNKNQIIERLNSLENFCDGLVAIGDNDFPQYRGKVKESERPVFLFYKGNLELLNIKNINISIIGLLNPDENIEFREKKIVAEIVKKNVTIVSGLALGCDSIAHKQSLIGGKTIAILPSSLNNIMPATNRGLAVEIIKQGGLLITEYFQDHKSSMELSSRYKERNRLQALFCDAIILAASYAPDSAHRWNLHGKKLDSGSRLAMEFASEYEIPRAVMYDENSDNKNPMFDLNRQLISEKKNIIILTHKNLDILINQINNKIRNHSIQTIFFK